MKRKIRGVIFDGHNPRRFSGSVDRLEYNYGFLNRDGEGDRIYFNRRQVEDYAWDSMQWNDRVSFSLGFNFMGATAIDVTTEE